MDALTFDDLPSSEKAGGSLAPITFDDLGSDKGGFLSSVANVAKGAGERVTSLAGGLVRTLGNLPSPEEYINDLMYGDNRPANLPTRQQVTDTANEIAGKLESTKFGYEQGTSWEDFKASPIRNFIPFALEQGLVSTPDMIAAIGNLPAYIAARTGEMGQERAKNNNLDNATVEDLIKVLPGAVASSMLERLGAKGILADTAVTAASQVPKAIGKAAAKEGVTEAGQELIEYGSTNVGTEAGFDPATAAERMAAGAVAGTGFGAMARGASATAESIRGEPTVDPATQSVTEDAGYIRADQVDVPAKADSADILYGADPEVVRPETPEREKAVEELAPVDPERLDSPRLTDEDRASPLPNDLIDDGKAIMNGEVPSQPAEAPQTSVDPAPVSEPIQQAEAAPTVSVAQPITFDDLPGAEVASSPVEPSQPAPVPAEPVAPTVVDAALEATPVIEKKARAVIQRWTPDGYPADRNGNVKKPKSIIEFLAERGGVRDYKNELKGMGVAKGKSGFVTGAGPLVRKGGMPLDYARKLAVEAGYLTDEGDIKAGPSQSTVADLLDAIDQDARSGRTFFSQADANHVARWQESQRNIEDFDRYGAEEKFLLKQALDEVTKLTGAKADDPVAMDIATLMAQDGVDFDTAAIAVERRIDEILAGTGREYKFELPQSLKDIPFFGDTNAVAARTEDGQFPGDTAAVAGAVYENSNGSRGAGNPVQGSRTEGRPESTGGTGDGSRTVQTDDGKRAPEPRSEVGADEQRVIGFTTAKGSTYQVDEQGRTTRDKAKRDDPGHEGDFGSKPKTARTIYVDTNAAVLSAAGLSGIGGNGARVVIKDGKASLATWNQKESRWGIAPGSRDIPFSDTPSVGAYPLELWSRKDDIRGYETYSRMHAGNAIVSIKRAQNQTIPDITTESGADGKQQLVIPGAEQISQREQAQRKADEKLKPKVEQRDAGGMFGDDVNSPQLFDKPAPKVEKETAKVSEEGSKVSEKPKDAELDQKLFSKSKSDIDLSPGGGSKEITIGDTTITYGISRDGETGEIILVKTPKAKRGAGSARTAMQALLKAFDNAGVTAFLTPEPMDKGISKSGLVSFYKSLGFVENKGRNKDFRSRASMIRDEKFYQKTTVFPEEFKGDIDAITADLRQRLDKLGLPDVALRVVPVIEGYANGEKFTAHGSYFRGLIDISLQAPDKVAPLNHEAIHALKNLNAFTKTEWSMLSAKSKSDWMNRYGINEAYSESSEAVRIEEGIAAAYTEWASGREKAGAFARLFQKIKDIIASIGNALRGNGYDSVGKIFQRVESGDVGNSRFFKNDADADGAKRFQIVKDPANQEEAKQVMQGFIARGQPIDRAIRLPFEVLGGINKDGTWKPALKVNEKLGSSGRTGLGIGVVLGAGIGTFAGGPIGTVVGGAAGATAGVALLRANISPNGRFGWLYPFAENARRGLIDRYGLSEEYVAADRARQTSQRGIMQKAEDILQVLQNASVGPAEAKVLQAVLTGENVSDAEMMKVAAPIRKAIDELGAEAVSLGLISAESFERNRGAYLHRVYQKNEMDQSGVIAWGSKFMAKKRVKIMGDQLKGRGIFWDVPLDKLMADVPGWVEGTRGKPSNGDRFRVLDYVAGTSKDLITGEEKGVQTKRRAYLPAGEPLPEKFQGKGWEDRGEWEVRGAGKNVTLWRDYTKEERTKMGEILDARYTIAKTFMMMANDLSTGRFYKQVAENEDWAQIKPPAMEWREAADYGRFWNDPEIGWVRVPETTIANSGGKKRYGALSGMFVRAEIWRDLNEVDQMQQSGLWRTILTQWKINKTARSPVTHTNNILSNVMFMDLADVRLQDLTKGIKSFAKGDAEYIAARDAGAFGGDMIAQEIRKEVLQPILDEIAKTGTDGKNPLLDRLGVLGTVADKIWTWAKAADDRMLTAYQMEDEVFRMATYLRRRSLGDSVDVAARHAREQFLDYDIRAPWVNAARNSVLPFISYSYRAIPKVAENVMNRPWKVAKYFALAYAANMLAYMWDDGDDGEDRERASLRDEEQGYTWFGIPRMMRMPYRDKDGMPVFLDVRRWIPSGDVFDTNQGQSAIPVPASLQLGGPLLLAFEFALNKQSFTGNEITNELTDTAGDKVAKVGDWLWKSWMPSAAWVPNSWYWEKIENALKGAEDYSGRKYSLPEATLSSVGIKLKPQNVQDGLGWKQRAFKEVERELRSEARRLANNRQRGLISQSEFDKSMAQLSEKFTNLGEKAKELGEQAKPKPKP